MSLSNHLGLLGRKVGMMRLFTDDGDASSCYGGGCVKQPRDPGQNPKRMTATLPCR
jgi:ribosomal protein L3